MDVAVDAARREDQVLARDSVRCSAGYHIRINTIHRIGVARFTDACDAAILDAHVGLYDADYGVDDRDVGDDQVERPGLRSYRVGEPHSVAHSLASTIDHFVAIVAQVALDLDVEIGIAQTHFVAHRRAE